MSPCSDVHLWESKPLDTCQNLTITAHQLHVTSVSKQEVLIFNPTTAFSCLLLPTRRALLPWDTLGGLGEMMVNNNFISGEKYRRESSEMRREESMEEEETGAQITQE